MCHINTNKMMTCVTVYIDEESEIGGDDSVSRVEIGNSNLPLMTTEEQVEMHLLIQRIQVG